MKPTFEVFRKRLINEQDRLIASGQLSNNKALMTHSKKNPNNSFNKNSEPHNHDRVLLMMLLMFLTWCLTKRKCLILESIVAKPTNLK